MVAMQPESEMHFRRTVQFRFADWPFLPNASGHRIGILQPPARIN
jgi:hypothetical protein